MDHQLLIFTDLDGTLLDHLTYSFNPALPALTALLAKKIPLIICTSKTRAEIEEIRLSLQNTHPFISENGGAIFIPKGYFPYDLTYDQEDSEYLIIEIGTPYRDIRKVLIKINQLFPGKIRGFGDLSIQEVSDLCGLSINKAKLAKKREFDEPFILEDVSLLKEIQKIAKNSSLQITQGGRFFHIMGSNDKGEALSLLRNIYRLKKKSIKTIALGDSFNDEPMLRAADYPVLVQKQDGNYDPTIKLHNLILAEGVGPAGWSKAVLKIINGLS